jgi:D-glycero-D-manno-heptose 1,7-bisphosphate phosphatase
MILKAMQDFDIDLDNSILVGDSLKDVQAANAAGVSKVFWFRDFETLSEKTIKCTQISKLVSVIPYLINSEKS